MPFYAHTANGPDDTPLPESSGKWQLLATHLRKVADLAARFAAPFNASEGARFADLQTSIPKKS